MKAQIILLGTLALFMFGCKQNEPTYRTGKDLSVKGHCYRQSRGGAEFFIFSDSTVSFLHGNWLFPETSDTIYRDLFYWQEYEIVKLRVPGYTGTSKINEGISIIYAYGDFIIYQDEVFKIEY